MTHAGQKRQMTIFETNNEPSSKRPATVLPWSQFDSLHFSLPVNWFPPVLPSGTPETPSSIRLAAFDLDDTLCTTASGRKFPKDGSDVAIMPHRLKTLVRLSADGFLIVIFSNQAGQLSDSQKRERFDVIRRAAATSTPPIPIAVFFATGKDIFRKPFPGMYDHLVTELRGRNLTIDALGSFYCGDAAGRPADGSLKADFAASDRHFAENVRLPFRQPEEIFECAKPRAIGPEPFCRLRVDPGAIAARQAAIKSALVRCKLGKPELVLFVGPPAAGKSSISSAFVDAGYVVASNDIQKTKAKCMALVRASLAAGSSVVVDNTNPDPAARAEYIALATAASVPVRAVLVDTPRDISLHLNAVRGALGGRRVPRPGIFSYWKRFSTPTADEGFMRVDSIPFAFDDSSLSPRQISLFTAWSPQ
jgi:bifunctional polynucleotide phosphatase/kinase